MTVKEKTKVEILRVCVDCTYSNRLFLTTGGKDASNEIINELDKKGIVEQPGKLAFKFISETETGKVVMEAIFRGIICRRTFVTVYNKEAFNMLMNRLIRKRIFNQQGRLAFEFVPGVTTSWAVKRSEIDSQICTCGHNRFAHLYVYGRKFWRDRGRCDVEGCSCGDYVPKPKEAPG